MGDGGRACPDLTQKKLCGLHPCGAHVCTTSVGFPLTCTYEKGIVYTHHVTDVCTCLCWPKTSLTVEHKVRTSSVDNWTPSVQVLDIFAIWRKLHVCQCTETTVLCRFL